MTQAELDAQREKAIRRIYGNRPIPESAGIGIQPAQPKPDFSAGGGLNPQSVSRGISEANNGGILSQPVATTPKGDEYMRALDRIAPNVYAPTPQSLGQQPGMGMSRKMVTREIPIQQPNQGPMSGIYGSRAMNQAEKRGLEIRGGGLGLAKAYNEAAPRSVERADTLNSIWQRGGVPVIGGGKERAAVQDFGGADRSVRGIDTGILAGSPEAEARQARMDASGRGDVYGRPAGLGLQQNHLDQMHGNNLQSRDSRRRKDAEAYFSRLDEAAATKQTGLGLTPELAMKKYEIDENAGLKREEIAAGDRRAQETLQKEAEAQKRRFQIKEVDGVWMNGDGNALPQEIQDSQTRTKNTYSVMAQSFGDPEMVMAWRNNPTQKEKNRVVPVYDRSDGTYKWMAKKNIPNKTMPDGKTPIVQPLAEYDPAGYRALVTWLDSAKEEEAEAGA